MLPKIQFEVKSFSFEKYLLNMSESKHFVVQNSMPRPKISPFFFAFEDEKMRNFEVNKGLQTWTFSGHLNIYKKQTFLALSYHFRISSEKYSRNSYLLTYPNSISRKIFPWSTFFHSFPQRLSMNLVHSHPHPWQPACSLLFIHKTLLTLHDTRLLIKETWESLYCHLSSERSWEKQDFRKIIFHPQSH